MTSPPVAPLTHAAFPRNGHALYVDGVPLTTIADAVGTPTYVYSANTIRARYQRLTHAFDGVKHSVHFAMKSNSSHAILQLMRDMGAGVDIVSGGELFRAMNAGFVGRDIVFSGVGKTVTEIAQALSAGVLLINIESEAELLTVQAVALAHDVVAPIAIRVNPEVMVNTPHAYIRTGEKGQKFGIPQDDVERIAALALTLSHVSLKGLGMHLGSQIANADPMREALPKLLAVVERVRSQGHQLEYLDVGGGLAVPYEAGDADADVDDYATVVRAAIVQTGLHLLLEPGRYVVAEAGVLLSRVLYRKHAAGKDFVVTDAGMNDLIRPSLYQAHHDVQAVNDVAATVTADLVGPICESGDFLARQRVLPDVVAGELIAVHTTGAYGYTMSSTYNSRPRPAEVLVDGEQFAVITKREELGDLIRLEQTRLQWRKA